MEHPGTKCKETGMAETRIGVIQKHLGTASERAAMSTTGLPLGSTFYETDTKLTYIFDLSNWFILPGVSGGSVAATTKTGSFTGFTGAEAKTTNITGISSNNPVIRRVSLWVSNDPTGDENINAKLGFYNADSMTEDELIIEFALSLTYTETNGGASATDTTDTVDDIGGLNDGDLIRYMGGTAENVRLTVTPSGTTLTFTALANTHADDTGIVRVAEIPEMFQLVDDDASNEIHIKLETLSAPSASMNVAISIDVQ